MSKPVEIGTAAEAPPPVVLVPKPAPTPSAPPPAPRARRAWLIAGLLSLAVLGAVAAFWWLSGTTGTVRYTTAPVTRGNVTRTVTATGTVNPVLTIIVGSYVSGVIQEINCDYNTEVKVGQVCARIDPRPYQTVVDQNRANLAVAKAQLEKDKANLAYAQLTYDRSERLAQTNAVSKDTVDNAKNALDQAKAQIGVDQATIGQRQAQLEAAQVNLGYTDIVSPVNGTVVSRNVTVGQTVAASFQTPTLFLIATSLTEMQVDTNVSESDIGGITVGDKATFTVDAFPKRTFDGKVTQIRQSPQTVQNVVTYDVVVSVDNGDLALKPGMTASTRIVIDQRPNVLRVPSQALRYAPASAGATVGPGQGQGQGQGQRQGQAQGQGQRSGSGRRAAASAQGRVFVLRDNEPVAVPVTAGLDDDTFTEIVKGELNPGDRVIVSETRNNNSGRTAAPSLRF
ncbi:MAG TPA: efflux RND transporter periplasmic adaptor subunit [Pseudolabrys sp.]|nr:efflux RND transporter periplasmic adaptor subunit [Pseudolabrys sp.]